MKTSGRFNIDRSKLKRLSFLWVIAVGISVLPISVARAWDAQAKHVRWDIIHFDSSGTALPGGSLSGTAVDGSRITLTGTGTFVAPASDKGKSNAVTGGGTWATNTPSASGAYKVEGFVRYDEAPGTLAGLGLTDGIGDIRDTHAGLGIFSIRYSDGERGVQLVMNGTIFRVVPGDGD